MVEIVWKGKYDDAGRKVPQTRIQLPLQTIETVNESTQDRQKRLESFVSGREDSEWRNRLIWGDKKYVLPALLQEYAGTVDLIYIDPPFATGADFSFFATVPEPPATQDEDNRVTFVKEPSIIEQKAYRDTWGLGVESYLHWFWESAILLRDLLAPTGTLYVHLDWRMVHYARIVLDEVFGPDRFENEIIWQRSLPHGNIDYKFGASHDSLLRYTKSDEFKWFPQYTPYRKEYLRDFYKYTEPDGRRYRLISCINPNPNRPNLTYPWKGVTKVWKFTKQRMAEMDTAGLLVYSKNGIPQYKGYLDQMKGVPLQDVWTDIPPLMGSSREWLAYPTQKPEALIERLLRASTEDGDLVFDCFVGSGTTAAVAEKLNRRWIACDLSRFAIHTTRKRLLGVPGVKPFTVQNLGKYERQAWQAAEFGNEAPQRIRSYTDFILKLYNAQSLSGHSWIHGKKGNRLLHVGPVDSPISPIDVGQIVAEFKRMIGKGNDAPKNNGVDILGWDFAFEINELAKQQAEQANVNVRFLRIPREVLDKKAVEQGDIHFFELAALDLELKTKGMKANIAIKDFVIPLDDVPSDVQKQITHWSQWIDYWAVDWDNKNDTFHNEVQEYRTHEKPELTTELSNEYQEHGDYRILVKVIDILGNDTTKMIPVKV